MNVPRGQSALSLVRSRAVSVARRMLGRGGPLEDAAVATEVIDPGRTSRGRAGLCLPGQLDRVTKVAFDIPLAKELAEFTGAERTIGATIRREYRDVTIEGYRVTSNGGSRLYRDGVPGPVDVPLVRLDEAGLRTSFVGVHFFGHWLRDDTATQLLAERYGPVIAMQTPDWPDKRPYRAMIGRDFVETAGARIGRLHMFDDISQTHHKVARFGTLRAQFAAQNMASAPSDIVYLARGTGGTARHLVNEDALIEALASRGVQILRAEDTLVDAIVAALQGARILISVEGSQISHGLLTLADKAGALVLQPPDRFFNSHMDWLHALDMHYAVVVGTPHEGGFSISEHELFATLDLLDRAIEG